MAETTLNGSIGYITGLFAFVETRGGFGALSLLADRGGLETAHISPAVADNVDTSKFRGMR
jgi:hypothetical protein